MNFVSWFANLLIDFFGFESDMAIGLSVILGIFVMIAIVVGISFTIVKTMFKMGWIKDEMD